MTEKLSEEVRQAVRDTVYAFQHEQLGGDPDTFVRAVEKRLEPKHPPKGAICEVWDDTDRYGTKLIGVSLGDGTFSRSINGEFADIVSHYRRIVTAEDALAAVKATFEEMSRKHEPISIEALEMACEMIQDLIDNAMEG